MGGWKQVGIVLLFVWLVQAQPKRSFRLPAAATVTITESGFDAGESKESCAHWVRYTPASIRRQFRTYHEVSGRDVHDYYLYGPCWATGTVTVSDRTYSFTSRLGNLLFTDFPDGTNRRLGGKRTDDPSAGEKP